MDDVEKNRILDKVVSSFSSVPYPYDYDYFKAIADRDYLDFKPGDQKKHWDDISEEELLKYYDFIFFLDPEGVIYYLPSYIKVIMENTNIADHRFGECLFMEIADLLDPKLLNENQKQSIKDFLKYCLDSIHPENELDDVLIEKAISNLS